MKYLKCVENTHAHASQDAQVHSVLNKDACMLFIQTMVYMAGDVAEFLETCQII